MSHEVWAHLNRVRLSTNPAMIGLQHPAAYIHTNRITQSVTTSELHINLTKSFIAAYHFVVSILDTCIATKTRGGRRNGFTTNSKRYPRTLTMQRSLVLAIAASRHEHTARRTARSTATGGLLFLVDFKCICVLPIFG